ncbi:MAG: helix-turn-helix domain-containing protein [Candidatus Nomurabacteria bacterium]|nr:MAG: helix-turn-helix domain-containing protein [Candidatus Nomurabacteria bacterium]
MSTFRRKQLRASITLGERLKSHRLEQGWEIFDVAESTHIAQKYIQALEEGAYGQLPGEVYIRNFLRQYANFLRVSPDDVISSYEKERGLVKHLLNKDKKFVQRHVDVKPVFTPRRLRILGFTTIVVVVLAYLVVQAWSIIRAPELVVDSPEPQLTTIERTIKVGGMTEAESEVTINGQRVLIDTEGRFSELIDLHEGLNTIQVVAKKKRSQASTITRQVLVTIPEIQDVDTNSDNR